MAPHVLVTGAGTGIGRAIALRLAADGARLSLLARDVSRLEETARLAGDASVTWYACDVRDAGAVERAFEAAVAEHGALHAVVANSGLGGPNGPDDTGADRFDDLVDTNLRGTYHCFRAGETRLQDGGHLVAMSSILGRIGVPGYTGYCASKAAICGLVRAFAVELASRNVQVNAVCPGWVDTDMAHEGLAGMAKGMGVSVQEAERIAMKDVPLGRMSAAEDIAGLVAWLISADARGVTGQAIDMNGGAFMN